jgi:hypothetical protein
MGCPGRSYEARIVAVRVARRDSVVDPCRRGEREHGRQSDAENQCGVAACAHRREHGPEQPSRRRGQPRDEQIPEGDGREDDRHECGQALQAIER